MAQLDRITRDPTVMGGKSCIRGMRITVSVIVGQIGAGHTIEELLADYPYLEREETSPLFSLRLITKNPVWFRFALKTLPLT